MNSKLNFTTLKKLFLVVTLLSSLVTGSLTYAASTDYKSIPATILTPDARPIVMLTMTNDHQLSYKAYTDYDDIIKADGTIGTDGTIEITYTDVFNYYGYFDSKKCYSYSTTNSRFEPSVTPAAGTNSHNCSGVASARWNGNFLNWITMSRMDIVRKVLYGGYRQTDSATETVLERAYIPDDNHAWAKHFPAANIDKFTPYSTADSAAGLTFCNVTPYDGVHEHSHETLSTPRLRIAKGKWGDWAAQEIAQCMWDAEAPRGRTTAESPDLGSDGIAELVVRVKVCDSSIGTESNCRQYGTSYKPSGLLQKYGEIGTIDFGLLTGSYEKGKSGGVLRKNISPIVNVSAPDTSIDEIDLTTGQFTAVNGIISTLNKLRISRYSYTDIDAASGYGDTGVDNCSYGQNTWNDGACSNWGNPMGEIYLEALRYFSGAAGAHTDFAAPNDATWLPGIATSVTWRDPFGAAATAPAGGGYLACAKPNIINFSTGVLGFDHDQYTGQADVGGTLNVVTETNTVGASELNALNTYYVGNTNSVGTAGDTCSAQTITGNNLATVTGLCPEAAGLQGSFKIAGLAAYAQKTDLRSGISGIQNVNTYSIALAPPIPDIKVTVGTSTVRIIPVARNFRDSNEMVLVNFEIISQTATSGEFYMNYENAPAGADHDSDFKGYLRYDVTGSEISITATNTGSSAGSTMHMGYLIDGVTDPGIHYAASNQDVTLTADAGAGGDYNLMKLLVDAVCSTTLATLPPSGSRIMCTTNIAGGVDRDLKGIRTHTAGTSTAVLLKTPLWYAAKWGNFKDIDNSNTPNTVEEWDAKNNATGALGSDGEPDSYFLVTNPNVLETRLDTTLNEILQRISAGSAAAVIADSVSTVGSLYQALYQPIMIKDGKKITWIGYIHGIFLDEYGNLREDTDGNKRLDTTDKYVKLKYSADQARTQVWYCTPSGSPLGSGPSTCLLTDRKELSDFKPIWNARDELAKFSATDTRLKNQRPYTTPFTHSSNGGRHIFTWQDVDGDNVIDAGEVVDFTEGNFGSTKAGLLGVPAADASTEPAKIVNFIRGYEDPANTGYRSRTIDFLPASGDEVWRLGDIVHSSPIAVGAPDGTDYSGEKILWETYGDSSYSSYRIQYQNRRTVIYVGGNDGLIHAYNAGFYNSGTRQYCLDPACANDASLSHTLGSELWAYAPRNLLPQLKFLTEPDYPHVYYADGEPQTFDVNIFPPSATHPNGWGTILVVGMRLGGGANNPINVDVDNTGTTIFDTNSAYVIFDVTNPEVAPTLLGEFKHSTLGFTTSKPTLVALREPSATVSNGWSQGTLIQNTWILVFGSGPTTLDTVLSAQTAKLYFLPLEMSGGILDMTTNLSVGNLGIASSFVGNPIAKNWNTDFRFDAIYFGLVGGTELTPTGNFWRIALNYNGSTTNIVPSIMFNPYPADPSRGQPFLNTPLAKSIDGQRWVYAGTGRLFTNQDNLSTEPQTFYGFKEGADATYPNSPDSTKQFSTSSASTNHVQNVTDVVVYDDNSVSIPPALSTEMPTVTNFDELVTHIDGKAGWHINFPVPAFAERNITRATYYSHLIAFPSYLPNADTCSSEGSSYLYLVYEKTGTAFPGAGLGLGTGNNGVGGTETLSKIDFGVGIASQVTVKKNIDGQDTLIATTSTGEVIMESPKKPPCTGSNCSGGSGPDTNNTGRQSWREINIY